MKPFKTNFFVKTVYAYFDLFTKFFPIIIIMMLALSLFDFFKNSLYFNYDFLNLFNDNYSQSIKDIVWFQYFILCFNLVISIFIYLILKRLNNFLKNTFNDEPFSEGNGINLKAVGNSLIAISFLFFLKNITTQFLPSDITSSTKFLIALSQFIGIVFNPYFILGLFSLVLGEIIIKGSEIKEEIELTV